MKVVYYSEALNKEFASAEACVKAEKEYEARKAAEEKMKANRADRAHEVEDAYKHYLELRSKFIDDYGSYHMTLTNKDLPKGTLGATNMLDLIDHMFYDVK